MPDKFIVTPNPINNRIAIGYINNEMENQAANLILVNTDGLKLENLPIVILPGENNWEMKGLDRLPKGIYMLHLIIDKDRISKKLIKL